MRLNLLKTLNENFGFKVFAAFALFIFVISFSFTSLFIHHQSNSLKDSLIKKGKLLVNILAHNSRIGVFSENQELLNDPINGAFQQEGVLEASVFNVEGKLLSAKERPEIRASEKSAKGGGVNRHKILEKLKESSSPQYVAGTSEIAFWSPVITSSSYSTEEPLFFKEGLLQGKDRIIGFVRITVDKRMLDRRLNDLLLKGILIGVVCLVLGFVITYLTVRGITKPLNRLTKGVRTVGMGGAVDELPVETEDEIGKLARAFNYMTESLKTRERTLRESQQRYRSVFENTGTATMIIEEDMTISMVNTGWEKLSGYSKKEVEGKKKWTEFVYKEDLERMEEHHRKRRGKGAQALDEYEFRFFDRHGNVKDILGKTGVIPGTKGRVVSWLDITKRKQAEAELKRSQEELRNLTAHLQSVREEERRSLARDIHDDLGQALTALKMDLSLLTKKFPKDQKPLLDRTQAISKLMDTSIETVKRISTELRPGVLDDLGLTAAIEWQAEEFQHRTGITCEVTSDPRDIILDRDRSTAIFRIFQESLTNVARHAQATRVTASLEEKAGTLELKVRDNGRGITKEQISDPKSFGIMGMRERVYPWKGQVKVKSGPGKGTTVAVRIPLTKEAEIQ
jgi:two-component system sensor histidine kinase UhpB